MPNYGTICGCSIFYLSLHLLQTIFIWFHSNSPKLVCVLCHAKPSNSEYTVSMLSVSIELWTILNNVQICDCDTFICLIQMKCFSILVYLILFGCKVSSFFELVSWNSTIPPLHACRSNAGEVREEVENLKTNFNNRMKQILFSSVLNAYYTGFIPCCFSQVCLLLCCF